jgi:WD40 repeat protein
MHSAAGLLGAASSGWAGKSSRVRAGLVPLLRSGVLPGGATPLVVHVIPGAHPFEELEAGLLRVAVNPPDSLMEQLRTDERGLVRAVKRALPEEDTRELVLVIDQFEELFTLVADERVRADFNDSLFVAVGDPRGRLRVVVTLRADYYDRPLGYLRATEMLNRRSELVGPLSADEMYRAITAPAQRVGLELERGLAATILQDLAEQPGTLPLLQYTLTELYERRTGRALTLAAYRASGGVFGALAGRTEQLYRGLTGPEQAAARQLFLRLATPGAGEEDTRRRVLRAELVSAAPDAAALQQVLDLFGRYRMLTFDRDPLTGGPTVEVAHEALLRIWPRLRAWLADSRDRLHTERRLMLLAAEWQAAGQDPSFLARGARLAQLAELAAEAGQPEALALTAEEQEYLAAGLAQEQQARQEEQARQHQELALQKRAAGRLRALVGGLALFLLIALGLTLFALDRQRAAQASAAAAGADFQHAEALRLAGEANILAQALGGNDQVVALLAIRSMTLQYSPQGDAMLGQATTRAYPRRQLIGHTSAIRAAVFSADGTQVLTAGADGTARLWDAQTGAPGRVISLTGALLPSAKAPALLAAALSPDGRYVLAGGNGATVRLWDRATGEDVQQFRGHTGAVLGVAFSPDGTQVLTGSVDKTARLWDVRTGQEVQLFRGHTRGLSSVAFAPDGTQVITSSQDGTARLWDIATGQEVRQFPEPAGEPGYAVFAPDGKTVLTVGTDYTARLWDAHTGAAVQQFSDHTGSGVREVAFAPDGKTVLTGDYDSTARLWDVATGAPLRTFAGHADQVNAIAFAPDGQSIVTAGNEGIALVWSVPLPPAASPLGGPTDKVGDLAFSPDGKYVLTGNSDQTARLWDAQTHAAVQQFAGHTAGIVSVAFSPDGQSVLTSSADESARVWNTQTGAAVISVTEGISGIYGAVFAPDGKTVLTKEEGEHGRTLTVWDAQTGQRVRHFVLPDDVNVFGFSPDGTWVLISPVNDSLRIWDLLAGREVRRLSGNTNVVQYAIFSPDGKYVLGGSGDHMARLWDAQTGQVVQTFVGHTSSVRGIAFSPDGRYVLTSSDDKTARLWDVRTGQELRRFTGPAEAVYGVAFAPNGRQVATVSADGTARLWDVDYQETFRVLCGRLSRDLTDAERAQYGITDQTPTCPQR